MESGIKARATVARIDTIRTKDSGYRNVAEFIIAVQDIAAVCRSHC